MLLTLASAVILGPESRRTHDHILLSQIRNFPFRRLLRLAPLVRVTLRLAVYRQAVRLGAEPLEIHGQNCFPQLINCGHILYVTSSKTRGWVSRLQFLLALASALILRSESAGFLIKFYFLRFETSPIWSPGGPGGPVVPPPPTGFPFRRLLRLAGLRWR
jgi:hypothetical protein